MWPAIKGPATRCAYTWDEAGTGEAATRAGWLDRIIGALAKTPGHDRCAPRKRTSASAFFMTSGRRPRSPEAEFVFHYLRACADGAADGFNAKW